MQNHSADKFFLSTPSLRAETEEANHNETKKNIEGWVVKVLGFRRYYNTDSEMEYIRSEIIYKPKDSNIVPDSWRERLEDYQRGYGTYHRKKACDNPDLSLLRLGHPFVNELFRYLRWDDRGQAFSLWRVVPRLDTADPIIFFRFNYIVEADLSHLKKYTSIHGLNREVLYALSRKADGWFPPERRVMFLRDNMSTNISDILQSLLEAPYSKNNTYHNNIGYRDYNLNHFRMDALNDFVTREHRESLFRQVRDASEDLLRKDLSVQEKCEKCVEQAENQKQLRIDQLRTRLVFNHHGDNEAEREDVLYDLVIQGIKHPKILPDSIGMIVLSNNNPFNTENM